MDNWHTGKCEHIASNWNVRCCLFPPASTVTAMANHMALVKVSAIQYLCTPPYWTAPSLLHRMHRSSGSSAECAHRDINSHMGPHHSHCARSPLFLRSATEPCARCGARQPEQVGCSTLSVTCHCQCCYYHTRALSHGAGAQPPRLPGTCSSNALQW